jgi:hypothetical protein
LLRKVQELAHTNRVQAEELLVKWVNLNLQEALANKSVNNLGSDLSVRTTKIYSAYDVLTSSAEQDSVALTHLLHQLNPELCDLAPLNIADLPDRAEAMLANADKIGCRRFVSREDIVKGNQQLIVAFMATLFSKYPRDMANVTPTASPLQSVPSSPRGVAPVPITLPVRNHRCRSATILTFHLPVATQRHNR